mgnify:CR=1 FL=1
MEGETKQSIDEKFNVLIHIFHNRLKMFNLSQEEVDKISLKNGYYPAEKIKDIEVNYNKELKLYTLMEHNSELECKIENILWHLSAINKLIKDYETFK